MNCTGGRPPSDSFWSVIVVINQPSVGNCLNLLEVGERMCIESHGAIGAIEPVDECMLIGFARLDIAY